MAPSYASGIGYEAAHRRDDRGAPGARRAGASRPRGAHLAPPGNPLTYAELDATRPTGSRARSWPRGSTSATASASGRRTARSGRSTQFATAKAGIILVNINPAYRPTELAYALKQSGCRLLVSAQSFKTSDYVAMVEEVRGDLPALERVVFLDSPGWDELLAEADARRARRAAQPLRGPAVRRPDQHPVHERHDGLPEGRHAQPPQHPQQRVLRRRAVRLHEGRPRLHPRAALPLLRHGHGQPRLRHPRRDDGATPSGGFEPGATLEAVQEERCTSLYGVPTMFIAELAHPGVRLVRPLEPAHRDHGRLAVPGRGHAPRRRRDAHGRGDHLLRHDGDVAGVDADHRARTGSSTASRPSGASTRTSR